MKRYDMDPNEERNTCYTGGQATWARADADTDTEAINTGWLQLAQNEQGLGKTNSAAAAAA